MNLYNDIDPYCCQWLRNLVEAGEIPPGDVVEGDIRQLDGLERYHQVHLFCGIAGWSKALELAGWQGPVWTGSCPCQPFSAAGKRKAEADERDLWPAFRELIEEYRPVCVFGEQVSGVLGYEWLARVHLDLEGLGYRFGACDLPACSVGAPHIRQRLFWVADAECYGLEVGRRNVATKPTDHHGRGVRGRDLHGGTQQEVALQTSRPSTFWTDSQPEPCALVDGVSNRVGALSAYGNAIVPQVAAAFVKAYMEARCDD